MLNLKQNYKNLKRSKEILSVFVKYGLGHFFDLPAIEKSLNFGAKIFHKNKNEKIKRLSMPERIRLSFEQLGPTFVKLGQILSTRPDLIPKEFIEEFKKLQDQVPAFDFSLVEKQFEKEFGKKIDNLFIEFNKIPIAAASISQVHRAKLKDNKNNKIVAVKIQRPNIHEIVKTDIAILLDLAKFIEKRSIYGQIYQPVEIIKEFKKTINKEMDFINEGYNIDKFYKNFKNNKTVKIPKVYWELTSNKILTMEYIDGVKISEVDNLKNSKFNKKIIASNGADMILKQIFEDGFFHGDPHPGNIFVMENNVIGLIDFGMVGRINKNMIENIADLLIAGIKNNAKKIVEILEKMNIIESDMDLKNIEIEIDNFIDKYYGMSLKKINMGKIIEEILEVMIRHKVKMPTDLVLLSKSLITVENIGRNLDPDFDMVAHTKPYAKKLLKEKHSPSKLLKRGNNLIIEFFKLMELLPSEINNLFKIFKKNNFNINLKHQGLEKLILGIDKASNRLSISMIISALIIGSSLILIQKIGPFIFGYSAIGIIGYLIASFFGLFLIISMLKANKWK